MDLETKLEIKKNYQKEYYEKNKAKYKIYSQKYYQDHKELLLTGSKKYYQEHKEERKQYNKKYYKNYENKHSKYCDTYNFDKNNDRLKSYSYNNRLITNRFKTQAEHIAKRKELFLSQLHNLQNT